MKRARAILSLALALILVFSLGSSIFAADYPENTFTDVQRSDWFAEAVDLVQAHGFMAGVGDNLFAPYGEVTRAMVVTVLYRITAEVEGDPPDVRGLPNPFWDVTEANRTWYTDAVIWASWHRIAYGVTRSEFDPDTPITREQMAAMMMRFFAEVNIGNADPVTAMEHWDSDGARARQLLSTGAHASDFGIRMYNEPDFRGYSDAADISDYALWSVVFCAVLGIMKGDAEGSFRPQATLTRAEFAQIILNFGNIEFK